MSTAQFVASAALLFPVAAAVVYTDVRYRRIPNAYVLVTLAGGLAINASFGGLRGLLVSLAGCALAFAVMFALHFFGTMGAGDVKLFAAVGAVLGAKLVLPALVVTVLCGLALSIYMMIRLSAVGSTLRNVGSFFLGLLPGVTFVRVEVPADRRRTLPYGVAVSLGSLVSLFLLRA